MTKINKRQTTIAIMKANTDKDIGEVSKLISVACDLDEKRAAAYYRWCVNEGLAPGHIPHARKKATEVAAVEAVAAAIEHKDQGPVVKSWAHKYIEKGAIKNRTKKAPVKAKKAA